MGQHGKEQPPMPYQPPVGTQGYTPANQLFFKDGQAYTRTGNISRADMDKQKDPNIFAPNKARQMQKMGVEPKPYEYKPFNFESPQQESYGPGRYGPAKKYGGSK